MLDFAFYIGSTPTFYISIQICNSPRFMLRADSQRGEAVMMMVVIRDVRDPDTGIR